MLSRRFPAQRDFVFANVEPAKGVAAVLSVSLFLDRLDALERGKGRKATRADDRAALELLAARGIGQAERQRLRALVQTVERGTLERTGKTTAPAAATPVAQPGFEESLVELYLWHKDWATSARAAIKRRDHLIKLGLARRQLRKVAGDQGQEPA